MPGIPLLLRGFGLTGGAKFGEFTLQSGVGTEEGRPAYKHYIYNITLTFTAEPDAVDDHDAREILMDELWAQISAPKVVNSEYGNPYTCKFNEIDLVSARGRTVVISAQAVSDKGRK